MTGTLRMGRIARVMSIGPVDQTWDSYFLDGLAVSDDFLPERATPHQAEREALWQCPP